MQERFFPLVNNFIVSQNNETESQLGRPFGLGFATPTEAHEFGLKIDSSPKSRDGETIIQTYQNRVQALWVPVQ